MGEQPQYSPEILEKHCKEADYLLILGTSLSIKPFASDLYKFWQKSKPGLILDSKRMKISILLKSNTHQSA